MSVFNFVTGITSTIGKTIEKAVIVPTGNLIAKGISKVTGLPTTPQTSDAFSPIYTNLLGGTALAAGLVAGGSGKIATAFKEAPVASTLKAGGVVIAGSALAGSTKAQDFTSTQIVNAPSNLNQFGSNIGAFLQSPSIQTATTIAKENPLLSAAVAGTAAYAGSKVVLPAIAAETTRRNTQAIQEAQINPQDLVIKDKTDYGEQQKLIQESTKAQIKVLEAQTKQAQEIAKINSPAVVASPSAIAPAGQSKTKKKKKKTTKKKKKKTRRSKKKKKTTKKKKSKSIKRSGK